MASPTAKSSNKKDPGLAPENRTPSETILNESHQPSYNSSCEWELIAEAIAELSNDCEDAFDRSSTLYHGRSRSSSFVDFQSQGQERLSAYYGIAISSDNTIEDTSTPVQVAPRAPDSEEHDCVPGPLSYRTSRHSSLRSVSTKYGPENLDSVISLPHQKEKRKGRRGHPQGAPSAKEDAQSPLSTAHGGEFDSQTHSPTYPSGPKTALIMISLYISIFLVALDRTIIGPAIPAITNKFNSIDDIGWYGSSYMLTSAGFILLYGRIYTFFPTKPVFLSGIFLFEAGSAICGAAQSSIMLIIGRAIAGLGSSGIFTGAILIMLNTVPLHKRPMLQGLFGACFGVASVAGPLLGGAFTQSKATWRFCFYINLPLGGITILVVGFFLKLEEQKPKLANWRETIKHLDPLGTALFLPSITCLLLALEWGSEELSWASPKIIAVLVVFSVLFISFIFWQYLTRHTTATIPARIVLQRSVAFGGISQFCVGATMLTVSIYIPLWFQAIKGASAMQSGINTIPLVLSVVVGSISSGALIQRIGYYTPFMILGSCFMAIGAGLLTTWNIGTKNSLWIGYQIILGIGVGWTMQQPNLAVQTILAKNDVPIGTAVLSLFQTLGGAVFTAVGQNLYISKFSNGLERIGGLDPQHILDAGATDLTKNIPAAIQRQVLEAYNASLTGGTFFAALIVACLAVPAAFGMEWRSVKNKQPRSHAQDEELQDQAPTVLTSQETSATSKPSEKSEEQLSPPVSTWKKLYRSSGRFSSYLTKKLNPDLRGELGSSKA